MFGFVPDFLNFFSNNFYISLIFEKIFFKNIYMVVFLKLLLLKDTTEHSLIHPKFRQEKMVPDIHQVDLLPSKAMSFGSIQ